MDLSSKIRTVPDFPKKGIMFRDITTLLLDPAALKTAIDKMENYLKTKDFDLIVAAESRGFIFGSILANKMGKGFVPVRKPGKLPAKTIRQEFKTEYSTDAFEMHEDAIKKGNRVVIVDDLVATGGTPNAIIKLVEKLGGKVVCICVLIELSFLHPREKLKGYEVFSLIKYDEE
ncbi:MAG: adenine phosphoribosyltransferase [archaeon]|nr:adenine phosphoribosyltransferase [archaeon]